MTRGRHKSLSRRTNAPASGASLRACLASRGRHGAPGLLKALPTAGLDHRELGGDPWGCMELSPVTTGGEIQGRCQVALVRVRLPWKTALASLTEVLMTGAPGPLGISFKGCASRWAHAQARETLVCVTRKVSRSPVVSVGPSSLLPALPCYLIVHGR